VEMLSGMNRVMTRIEQIESRMNQLDERCSGFDNQNPATVPATFNDALNNASTNVPGLPAAGGRYAPLSPDGQMIQPLSPANPMANYSSIIQASATKYNLNPELISAVMQVESGGNPNSVSRKGAMGLMQLMPSSASTYGAQNPFDPEQNIDAGSHELSDLMSEFGGNLDLALAAYNAGAGAVRQYGGVPPYSETQNYVRKIRSLLGEQ